MRKDMQFNLYRAIIALYIAQKKVPTRRRFALFPYILLYY